MTSDDSLIGGYTVTGEGLLYHTSGTVSLATGEKLSYMLSRERWCIGFDRPRTKTDDEAGDPSEWTDGGGGRVVASCPDGALATRGPQCKDCMIKSAIEPCMTCTGSACKNPVRRGQCVEADHWLYLAAYDAVTVKVGVTKCERFHTRIREQGALGAIAISRAGGLEVRRMETAIRLSGTRDRIRLQPLLAQRWPRPAETERMLRMECQRVGLRMPDIRIIKEGPWVWCADTYPAPLPEIPRVLDPKAGDPLAGTVLGHRGGQLLLRLDDRDYALSLRSLLGHRLRWDTVALSGPAQATFF